MKNEDFREIILAENAFIWNGGVGSGFKGHAGRKGKRGGSMARGQGSGTSTDAASDWKNKSVQEQFNELQKIANWTKDEITYADGYFGVMTYDDVQDAFRGGEKVQVNAHTNYEIAEMLDKKAKETEIPEDTTLYRILEMRKDRVARAENMGFTASGLQSTSISELGTTFIMENFEGDEEYYQPVMLKINAKKGSHGVASIYDTEAEVLLPSKIQFKVKNKRVNDDGILEFEVDYDQ